MKKIILLVCITLLVSCGDKSGQPVDAKNTTGNNASQSGNKDSQKGKWGNKDDNTPEKNAINVEASQVYTGEAISIFNTTTILEADLESAVTSKASGIVLDINVEVGDKVSEGDVLAVLESDVQELQFKSAEANYQKSLNNYERAKALIGKGLANQEQVDNLKFETKALKTKLDEARLDLEFTKVQAPISGLITKRNIKKGNLIPQHSEVFEIVNFESIQAIVNIPESKWTQMRNGLEARINFAGIDEMVSGKILRIDPVVDSSTGTFRVTIEINNTDLEKLRPGLFGKTQIILDKHDNAVLVSKDAVIREDKDNYVYVINDDKTVSKVVIETGYEMDDSIEVLSDLEIGQKVVTTGKNNISEESLVEVVE